MKFSRSSSRFNNISIFGHSYSGISKFFGFFLILLVILFSMKNKKKNNWKSIYYIGILLLIIGLIYLIKKIFLKKEKFVDSASTLKNDPPINVVNADEITMVNLKKQFDTTQCLGFIPEQEKYDFAKCGLDDNTQKWQLTGTGVLKNNETKAYITKTKNNELNYTINASNETKFIINKDNIVTNDNNYLCASQIIQNDCKDKVIKVDLPVAK
jgi:hypothetical protein